MTKKPVIAKRRRIKSEETDDLNQEWVDAVSGMLHDLNRFGKDITTPDKASSVFDEAFAKYEDEKGQREALSIAEAERDILLRALTERQG